MITDGLRKYLSVCEKPVYIKNKYTQEMIAVGCGSCPSCLLKKSDSRTYKCNIQQSLSKYCYFITLTYSTEYIPLARIDLMKDLYPSDPAIIEGSDSETFHEFRIIPRGTINGYKFQDEEDYYYRFHSTQEYIANLKQKINLSVNGYYSDKEGLVSYLNYSDVQLFKKRLRKNLSKILGSYENIHIYVVGEYGPIHFRPHYHLLLFFDSDKISQNIQGCISNSWRFGRVDCELARKGASSYVASYVNTSSSLPYLYRACPKARTFSRFSNHFAQGYFEEAFKDSTKRESCFLNGIGVQIGSRYVTIMPWKSVTDRFYPRFSRLCEGFVETSMRFIRSIREADKYLSSHGYFVTEEPRYKQLYDLILYYHEHNYYIPDCIVNIIINTRVNQFLFTDKEYTLSALARMYYKYDTFVINYLSSDRYDSDYYSTTLNALIEIEQFYKKQSLKQLNQFYEYQSEYYNESNDNLYTYRYFYDLSDSSKKSLVAESITGDDDIVKAIRTNQHMRLLNSVKHKKLNDKNGYFVKDESWGVPFGGSKAP